MTFPFVKFPPIIQVSNFPWGHREVNKGLSQKCDDWLKRASGDESQSLDNFKYLQ